MVSFPQGRLRVFLADDHVMLRQSLKAILELNGFDVVGEASDGQSAIAMCQALRPTVALLDIGMPVLNGVDAAREIHKSCPEIGIILLTMYADDAYVLSGLRAGATGYVLKSNAFSSLTRAIESVSKGDIYLSAEVTGTVVKAYFSNGGTPPIDPLSFRERQVLQLIAEGCNMKEVGAMLGISRKTAETHRTRITHKLEIFSTAGLVRYAQKHGLIIEQSCGSNDIEDAQPQAS
jgi:DNA-binding NarL/FixJ family response regulator